MALSAQISSLPPNTQLAAVAPTSGLVGYWNFDEVNGTTANDSSGNGNTGTLVNGPTWTTGKVGSGALSFDGVDDRINAGSSSSLDNLHTTGGLSISLWINPRTSGENGGGRIIDKDESTSGTFYLAMSGNTQLQFIKDGSTDLYIKTNTSSVSLNNWQHIALTWDGSTNASGVHIYVNGTETSYYTQTNGVSLNPDASMNLLIGSNQYGNYSFDGLMDEVRIYNRALSASEISDIYNDTGLSGGGTPPPAGDTDAPSAPANITASAISSTQVNLSWNASTDNVGVTGYRIYRNSTQIATSDTNSYSDTNVSPSSQYAYSVAAYDAAGNVSTHDSTITVSTPAPPASAPTISSFYASPTSITSGQSSTLSWSVTGATSLSISGIGAVTGTSVSVTPTQTTTYTLTATNAQGSVTANATITVTSGTPPSSGLRFFYVDYLNGNDNNNGLSSSAPWKHAPGDSNATGIPASTNILPGDTIIFKGGVQYDGMIKLNWSGSNNNPITYDGNSAGTWGNGKAIIDGNHTAPNYQGFYAAGSVNYINIRNFEIRNQAQIIANNSPWHTGGIIFRGFSNDHITITNNYIHDVGYWASDCTGSNSPVYTSCEGGGINITATNSLISGNEITKTGKGGISMSGQNNIITKNVIHDYIIWGISVSGDSGTAKNITISDNKIYNLFQHDAPFYTGPDADNPHTNFIFIRQGSGVRPSDILVEGNTMYNNYNFTDFSGTAQVFLSFTDNVTIRNNIFINPHSYFALRDDWGSTGAKIYNNTFYTPRATPININATGNTTEIINNIAIGISSFLNIENDISRTSISRSDYNLFINATFPVHQTTPYQNYSLSNWRALGFDTHSIDITSVDGLFTSVSAYPIANQNMNLTLQGSSQAIDRGTNISSFSADKNGISRPQGSAWDIGAYEYVSGSTLPSSSPPSITFTTGQSIQTTSNLNVRATASASGTLLGTQPSGSLGTIISGGIYADGLYWWNVNYDSGVDGYSAESYLASYTAPSGGNGGSTGGEGTSGSGSTSGGGSTGGSSQISQSSSSSSGITSGGSSSGNTSTTTCIQIQTQKLTRNLYKSLKGEDVKILQNFLISQNLLSSDSNTGFFGPLTEKAVQSFQKSHGIVSSGNFWSTGYGMVGPTTRSKINSMLSSTSCSSGTQTVQSLQEQIKILQAQVNALLLKLQRAQ